MKRTAFGIQFHNRLPLENRGFCRFSVRSIPQFFVALICLSIIAGCDSETKVAEKKIESIGEAQVTQAVKKSQTTSVTPNKADVSTSPAVASNALPSADADAAEVCARFMDLLKSGHRIDAENLLTRAALTNTTRAGLQLEPMGGPTAIYEVKLTRYATIEKKLAQVQCEIIEQIEGRESRSEVTWLVRKRNPGWRIAGLLVTIDPDETQDLLSFENIQDVEKIKALAAGETLSDMETRQASAPSDGSKLK